MRALTPQEASVAMDAHVELLLPLLVTIVSDHLVPTRLESGLDALTALARATGSFCI